VQVVLERTPFYAESGGQVADHGWMSANGLRVHVTDVRKAGKSIVHVGKVVDGTLAVGAQVTASVDAQRRAAVRLNHSATHLMHAALRKVLGTHVTQKGSLVEPDRLRFDFSHYQPVTLEEQREVERLVNAEIRANAPAETRLMGYEDAVASGAMALFGEKYDDEVRVLRIGDFSTELCGGTHVERAGDIGLFKIVSEGGVAAGVRRIEAVTGQGALDWVAGAEQTLRDISSMVKGGRDDVEDRIRQILERSKKLEKELAQAKAKLASGQGDDLSSSAVDVGGIKVVAARLDGADVEGLRVAVDQLKAKLLSAAIVLATVDADDKVVLVAGVTADQTKRVKAGDLVNAVAQQVGGRGGGRPELAQAGGSQPAGLDVALASVVPWVQARLA
jgi:alanyl-tRNA synthetase